MLRNSSLKKQLLLLLMLTFTGVLVLQLYYSSHLSQSIYMKNKDFTSEMMLNVETNVVSEVHFIFRVVDTIAYNDTLQQFLMEKDRLRQYLLFQQTNTFLNDMKLISKSMVSFVIVGTNGNNYNLGYDPQVHKSFQNIIDSKFSSSSTSSQKRYIGTRNIMYDGVQHNFLVAAIPIRLTKPGAAYGQVIGYFMMLVDPQLAFPQIRDISQKTTGDFYLLDADNNIFSSNDATVIGLQLKDEPQKQNYIITTKDIPEFGFKMISYLPEKELYKGVEVVKKNSMLLMVLTLTILFLFYYIMASNMIKPIQRLILFINKIRHQPMQLKDRVQVAGYAEINVLASKFNQMLDENERLTMELVESGTRVYELQLLRKQAEIAFLNSQINPHFLYNTLECIQGIAAYKNVPEIRKMTSALSHIFRYSIKEKEEVKLKEELQIAQYYLDIQQIRFRDRFEIIVEVDDRFLDWKVPKMILQPIVENAVFHGLELKRGRGKLCILSWADRNGGLVIVIKDNGLGMSPLKLAQIQELLGQSNNRNMEQGNRTGIGISNVNLRIKGAYGEPYGLSIRSIADEGTEVRLTLPGGDQDAHSPVG